MEIKDINFHLKQSIEGGYANTLDLSPSEIAAFLSICHRSLHAYICYANEQLAPDSDAHIRNTELIKIDSVFRELTDNFFPMAHSNESLRRLQIVDKDECNRIAEGLVRFGKLEEDVSDLTESLSQSIRRFINP